MEKRLRETLVSELRGWADTAEPSLKKGDGEQVKLYAPFFELGLNLIRNTATLVANDASGPFENELIASVNTALLEREVDAGQFLLGNEQLVWDNYVGPMLDRIESELLGR